jgi:type I restriction enzyme, S subunit
MANEWKDCSLGDVVELKRGYDLPQKERLPGDVPLVSSSGVTDSHVKAMVKGPGVVTGRYGTLGQVFYVEQDFWPLNTTLYVRDFKGNDPRFVSYFLRNIDFFVYSDKAAVPGLNRNHLHQARVRIPTDPKEQRAIAHILGTLDDKIELNRKQNETLEAMARTLFKAWFVDFEPVRAKIEGRWQRGQSLPGLPAHLYDLFPDRLVESELGEIPEGWRVGPLQELLVLQRGFDLPTQSRIEGQFPVIAAGGINGTHHEAMVKGPGVVTGRSGVLGNVFLELGDYWPLNTTLWVKEFLAAKPCYAYELLSCIDFKMFNAGSAVPTLNRNHIHVVPQIIPSSEVIGKFEDMAMVLHQGIVANNRQSRSLAQLRDTLLPKLISGELRVPEAERFVGLAAA